MNPKINPLLVVDDEENNRDLLTRRLERAGFAVQSACDGREALDLVRRNPYALVLLDYMMPGLTGLDVLKLLRATYSPEELPVIMVTALNDSEKIVEALTLGANDYVTKPLDYPVAMARIRSQLSRGIEGAALRESEERYARAARGANDGLWDWDLISGQVYYSPRWKDMLGYAEHEIGDSLEEWFSRVPNPDLEALRRAIEGHRAAGTSTPFECEHRMRHRNGASCWFLSRGLALRDSGGQMVRMSGSASDITGRKAYDALTGLPNRVRFDELLARAIEERGTGVGSLFAVLVLDLDRFKLVNDSLGHAAGDRLLEAVTERLRRRLSERPCPGRATLARLGGDEFALLMEGLESAQQAMEAAGGLLESLAAPFTLEARDVFCSASVGIAMSGERDGSADDMLRDADTAMYSAKVHGKGRAELFEPGMRDRVVSRLDLENDLRKAIGNQGLEVYYQPKVHLQSGSVSGFEALVRWNHPHRGLLMPGEFIAVAEDSGLIVGLGAWVLRKACEQIRDWNRGFAADLAVSVSVNVSPAQFHDPRLVPMIREVIAQTGIRPEWLDLEITESVFLNDAKLAAEVFAQLKSTGVGLKVDDFGTGYSSLSYLCQLPFDTLKIDRSFTCDVGRESTNREMIKTILSMARDLKMEVIAEGIETEEQARILKGMGCQFGQGYYFGKPMPASRAEAMLTIERQAQEEIWATNERE